MGARCEVLLALHVSSHETAVIAALVDIDRMVGPRQTVSLSTHQPRLTAQ